jgi:hypothetical protein
MRRIVMMVGVLGVSLWYTTAAIAAETATLTDIRYAALTGHSRVTLQFDGEVRYSPFNAGGIVKLGFSQTRTALPAKARRQLLNSGFVTAITVTPLSGDSLIVALMMRPGTTYRCVMPASGNALHIDVSPTGSAAASPRAAAVGERRPVSVALPPAKLPGGHPIAQKTDTPAAISGPAQPHAQTSVVVDIAAIAREQVLAESRAPVGHTYATPQPAVSPVTLLGVSTVVAMVLMGSGALLMAMLRKRSARRRATARPVPVQPPVPPAPRDPYAVRTQEAPEPVLVDPDPDDESGYEHETSLQLARTFRRGSEEITLARRMHDRTAPQLSAARMEETLKRASTPTQRLHFARKLGVGRGEMDLAMKLRTMSTAEQKEVVEQ